MSGGRRIWQENESRVFLKSWKDHVYLLRFLKQGSDRNPLYSAICKDLQKDGYHRSLTEIKHKMKNFRRRRLWAPENGTTDFKWHREVEEIMKMEKIEHNRKAAEPQMKQASELLYGPHVEGNVLESIEVITTNVPIDENGSDSDLLSRTAIKHAEPEVPNNIQMSLPQLSGSNSKKSTEAILLNICREFQSSNRQLEANDITILELFREQNEIFRKQTKLIMKLL